MKKNFITFCFVVATSFLFASTSTAQSSAVTPIIESGNYVFKPTQATGQKGETKTLYQTYFVKVSKDTIKTWLPYFNKESENTFGSNEDYRFNAIKFTYDTHAGRKGRWTIIITPRESGISIREMKFSVRANGRTSLRVTSSKRAPISYYGKIMK